MARSIHQTYHDTVLVAKESTTSLFRLDLDFRNTIVIAQTRPLSRAA